MTASARRHLTPWGSGSRAPFLEMVWKTAPETAAGHAIEHSQDRTAPCGSQDYQPLLRRAAAEESWRAGIPSLVVEARLQNFGKKSQKRCHEYDKCSDVWCLFSSAPHLAVVVRGRTAPTSAVTAPAGSQTAGRKMVLATMSDQHEKCAQEEPRTVRRGVSMPTMRRVIRLTR